MKRTTLNIVLVIVLLWLVLSPINVSAQSSGVQSPAVASALQSDQKVVIYLFWGEGCPHCAQAKPVIETMVAENPALTLYEFEIYNSDANQALFKEFGAVYGSEPRYVPTIYISDKLWEGYSEEIRVAIKAEVDRCLVDGCPDKGAALIAGKGYLPFSAIPATPEVTTTSTSVPPVSSTTPAPVADETTTLPLFGKVDLSKMGLFLSTLLISFVDGFNPCSLWVLSMLLAITLHTGSRKKVFIIGLVFLTVTAAVYALFIGGLFTVLKVVSFIGWIQVVVALVALFFGLVNIKDYFFYKEGVSFTISDEKKPGLFQRMRRVMDAGDSWWGLISGTVVLSAGVSLVEFSCTAGFPVLWTNLINAQHVTTLTFILLLLFYMFIYQIDELGIFLVAVFTLKSSRIEEKHGRILKLIGGVLMLTLAVVMLVNPAVMSNIGQSLVVFGIAFGLTIVILVLHRIVLPRCGVFIGTEFNGQNPKKSRKKGRH